MPRRCDPDCACGKHRNRIPARSPDCTNCGSPITIYRRGLCNSCYHHDLRSRKERGAYVAYRPSRPDLERLLSKVAAGWGGCWIYTGHISKRTGYGSFQSANQNLAHRAAYELLVGPIPDGLQLDHLCRQRNCVNPSHLEPVTAHENTHRSPLTRASINAAKTHCPHGHEYTSENTWVRVVQRRNGALASNRVCRMCQRRPRGGAATPTPGEGPSRRSQEIDPR